MAELAKKLISLPKITMVSTTSHKYLVDRWVNILLSCSVLLILATTLFPYDFFFKETAIGLEHYFLILKLGKFDKINFLKNILLFMPLGFGITYFMQKKNKGL